MPWWAWTGINLLLLVGHVKIYLMRKDQQPYHRDEEVSPEERAELDDLEREILGEDTDESSDDDLRALEESIIAEKPSEKVTVPLKIIYNKNTSKENRLAFEESLRQDLAQHGIELGEGKDES